MAMNTTDLERQLLELTKLRVEIDSQWIAVSEKLLATKANMSEAEKQVEVPQVSETSETSPIASPTQTANDDAHNPATRDDAEIDRADVGDAEVFPRTTRREVSNREFVPVTSPEMGVPAEISNQEAIPREIVPYSGPRIPPPPTSVPENTPNNPCAQASTYPQMIQRHHDTISSPSKEQEFPQGSPGINLGHRQLLRPHRSSPHHDQPSMNEQNLPPDSSIQQRTSVPFTDAPHYQSFQPESSRNSSRVPHPPMQMDPRTYAAWQAWMIQQRRISQDPRRIKAERMQDEFYAGQQSALEPRDLTCAQVSPRSVPAPYHPHFSSEVQPQRMLLRAHPQSQSQAEHIRQFRGPTTVSMGPPFDNMSRYTITPQRRQRSPSVEIVDTRPRQRRRLSNRSFDGIATPPLNTRRIKVEENTDFPTRDPDDTERFSRAQAPPPQRSYPQEHDGHDSGVTSSQPAHTSSRPAIAPTIEEPSNSYHEYDHSPHHRQLPTPDPHRAQSTRYIDEDYDNNDDEDDDIDEEINRDQIPINDVVSVPNIQYHRPTTYTQDSNSNPHSHFDDLAEYDDESSPLTARLATRRPFNTYRIHESKPLSFDERQELELRYCARVAMIIGSKRCVMAPCLQVSRTKNIFTIMREKFGQPVEKEQADPTDPINPATLYRSASDFVTDARGMLKCYVKLGHCDPCPFRVTGNERVMCWRMRLESVLDEKMRGLKKCLKECEEQYEVDDMDGRAGHVDMWFSEEELRDEVPIF